MDFFATDQTAPHGRICLLIACTNQPGRNELVLVSEDRESYVTDSAAQKSWLDSQFEILIVVEDQETSICSSFARTIWDQQGCHCHQMVRFFINWFCSWQSSVWRMKLSWISRDCSWLMLMLLHPSCNKMTVPKQTLSFNQPFSPSTWNTCFFTRWLATPNLTLQPFLPLFAIQPLEHVWLFYSLSKGFSSKIT